MKIEIERTVIKQALEALVHVWNTTPDDDPAVDNAIDSLRAAMAAPNSVEIDGIKTDPAQQEPDASKQWEPEFDAICPEQEALAKQFCEDIAQTHGGLMDPVRLLEMAEALYCAERDESIDPGSSDVVESVARNINADHDGKYCSDLRPRP